FSIAGDEWNRRPAIEQRHRGRDLLFVHAKLLCDLLVYGSHRLTSGETGITVQMTASGISRASLPLKRGGSNVIAMFDRASPVENSAIAAAPLAAIDQGTPESASQRNQLSCRTASCRARRWSGAHRR